MSEVGHIPSEVSELFDQLAHKLIADGWPRYSARAILHRIRWHFRVEKGRREFKCNNNWTPALARWWMAKNPSHSEFFETRASPSRHDMSDYGGPYEKHI